MKRKLKICGLVLLGVLALGLNLFYDHLMWKGAAQLWREVTQEQTTETTDVDEPERTPSPETKQPAGTKDPTDAFDANLIGGGAVVDGELDPYETKPPYAFVQPGKNSEVNSLSAPTKVTQLMATVYPAYGETEPCSHLEADTLYKVVLDAPEALVNGGEYDVTMTYPAQVTERKTPNDPRNTISFEIEDDNGRAYAAQVDVYSDSTLNVIHGSGHPQTATGGRFSPDRRNGTLTFWFYTGATSEHLKTHGPYGELSGTEGFYRFHFVRQ